MANGTEAGFNIGPIDEKAVPKVDAHISDAVARGAALITGGKPLGGLFFEPGVLTGVTTDMTVTQEEPSDPLHRSTSSTRGRGGGHGSSA